MTLFYDKNSIKSSLKSSAILHFRDSKLKNSPIMPRSCSARLGPPNFNYNLPPHNKKSFLRPNLFDIKTAGVKMLCFFVVFYCQDSIKSSLKSSAILHLRNSKLKNFPYKDSHLQRSTRASKLQLQPSPSQQKELPTAQFVRY